MKERLDSLLVRRGLAQDLRAAQAMIMAGEVFSRGRRLAKPGLAVDSNADIDLKPMPKYVSRGGDKLASVFGELGLNVEDKVVLDVGASTGGFTDFALKHGATEVIAVDVGHGQLAYALRNDPRVTVMERTDIRQVTSLPVIPDVALADVSFIALGQILSSMAALIKPGGPIVVLAKPQFEATRREANRARGVIKDDNLRIQILQRFREQLSDQYEIKAEADSKIAGTKGNVERFFVLIKR